MKNFFLILFCIVWNISFGSVTFYNVGQGNCTIVKSPSKKILIIDAGSSNTTGVEEVSEPKYASLAHKISESVRADFETSKWLWFVISHPDKDHLNLVKMIIMYLNILRDPSLSSPGAPLPEYKIGILFGGKASLYSTKDSKELLDFAVTHNINHKFGKTDYRIGDSFIYHVSRDGSPILEGWDETTDGKVDFLSMGSDNAIPAKALSAEESTNAASIVMKVQVGPLSIMVTGDKTKSEINGLIERLKGLGAHAILESDILLATHHGSLDDYVDEWPKLVNPTHLVISSGRSFDHPRSDAFRGYFESLRLGSAPCAWHCVQFQGDVLGNRDPSRYIKSFAQESPRSLDKGRGYVHALTNQSVFVTANQGNITFLHDGSVRFSGLQEPDLSVFPAGLVNHFLREPLLLDRTPLEIEKIYFDEIAMDPLWPAIMGSPSLTSMKTLSIKTCGLDDSHTAQLCELIKFRTNLTKLDLIGNTFSDGSKEEIKRTWGYRGLVL